MGLGYGVWEEDEPAGSPTALNKPPLPCFPSSSSFSWFVVGMCSCCSSSFLSFAMMSFKSSNRRTVRSYSFFRKVQC